MAPFVLLTVTVSRTTVAVVVAVGYPVRMSSTRNTRFALGVHLLTLIGGGDGLAQNSESMAASAGTNPVHVRRVLGSLREAGLVTSRHGPGGGWQLTGPLEVISLRDVWDAIHGDRPVLGLHDAAPECAVGQAVQRELVSIDRDAHAALRAELTRTTLADVVARTRAHASELASARA